MDRNRQRKVVKFVGWLVALRKESVDRNIYCNSNFTQKKHVALRKESVDRNLIGGVNRAIDIVALRKESVDRNRSSLKRTICRIKSLSARRAWIEIGRTL